jgi:hypothetical protein
MTLCPARGEVQRAGHAQQVCDAPGRQFTDAVAGDDETARHAVPEGRRGGQRLQGAENLAGAVAVESRARIGSDDIARISPPE